jgi:creatinine amidohydrolase/Fe(II)-dependent formamide hydrolase-like protein
MKILHYGLATIALMAAPAMLHAHGSMKPQHGGMVQMTGETMVELVAGPKGVDVYLSEEDEPIAAAGFTAKLTQTAAGAKTEAALKPAGANKLTAAGFKAAKGAKLVVALIDKSGAKSFATFQAK